MAKRRRDPESDGGTPSASGLKLIFVSTSLDTHLAMTLSLSDTVADFKEKIMLQHEQCFPEIGALTIHSLKVEHHGKMFRLASDTVVSIAFEECEGRWDLFVDASSSSEVVKEQNVLVPCNKDKLESSRLLLASDANASKSTGESSQHSLDVGHVDATLKSVEKDLISKDDSKIQNEKLPLRKSYDTRSGGSLNAKKKQKVEHSLHVDESSLDAMRTSPQATMSTRSNNEAGGLEDSVVHASPKVSTDVQLGGRDAEASSHHTTFSDAKNSEQAEPESHVFGKDSPSIRSQVSDMKNKSLEKPVAELRENMTSPDVPSPSLQVQEEQPAISTGTPKKTKRKKQHQETDVQLGGRDAGASPQNTMFSGPKTSDKAEPESHVFGKDAPSFPDSNMKTKSLEKSVGELKENMASPDIPSLQVQEEQPAISTSTSRKSKRKKKHQETNSSVLCDNAATSKPGTVLQGSVVTEEACEGQVLVSGNHGLVNDESLLTSTGNLQNTDDKEDGHLSSNHKAGLSENDNPPDSVKKGTALRETVICIGMVDKFPGADVSKSKIRNSKKSAVRKLDQLDADHDLSAPSKVCVAVEDADLTGNIDQSSRDENVLPQNDPKESEENSELAKNNVPGAVSTGRSNKHLDSDERNLNEKESASDIAFNVRDDPEGSKSGHRTKKKKTKRLASKDRDKDANDPSALKSLYMPDDVMADQSIFSRNDGVEEPKMVSPTNSHKTGNGNTASDYNDVHFPLSEGENNQSRNEDLDLMFDSQATVQGQLNMEHAKEAECLMDQPDEEQKNKGTEKKKRKKKGKRAGNSTGDGLGIPEVNQENVGGVELTSFVEKSTDLNFADEKRTVDQSGVSGLGLDKKSDVKGTTENEQLLQNSDAPDVPAHEIENNHEDIHATNNGGLASEGENGSVNFRRYFVPGDDHKGASTNKIEGESNAVEGAEKANEQTTVPERKRKPSKSSGNHKNFSGISTDAKSHEGASTNKIEGESNAVEGVEKANELTTVPERKQKPSKSSGNHKNSSGICTDAKSHERPLKEKQSKTMSEMGTSTNSRKKLKSLSTTRETNVKAIKQSVDPARVTIPPRSKENNGSLISSNTKSVSRDLKKTLLNKSNQKKQTGINIKNTAEGKISGKKDLLTKAGTLFGDDSSSSSDENGKTKSASSTQSPSDSSSSTESEDLMSGAGSNNNRGKTPFGSKLGNPRNLSMDMIMRSSNRFKKAKLIASQTEADSQVDFVPETQP